RKRSSACGSADAEPPPALGIRRAGATRRSVGARVRAAASPRVHLSDLRIRTVAWARLWPCDPLGRPDVRAPARRARHRAERVHAESQRDRAVRKRRLRGEEPIHEQAALTMSKSPTTAFSRAGLVDSFARLGARADDAFFDRLFDELGRAYSAADRHYHDVRHIDECLKALRDVEGLARRPAEIAVALWFH